MTIGKENVYVNLDFYILVYHWGKPRQGLQQELSRELKQTTEEEGCLLVHFLWVLQLLFL